MLFLCATAWATSCPSGYFAVYKVAILPQSSLSADLPNWTIYFNGSDVGHPSGIPGLKDVAHGGFVRDTTTLKDVVFCDAASGGNLLIYEYVPTTYQPLTGLGEWHIFGPTVSKTVNEFMYMLVGKAGAPDFSCNQNNTVACGTALYPNCIFAYHWSGTAFTSLGTYDTCGTAPSPTNNGVPAATSNAPIFSEFAADVPSAEYINSNVTVPAVTTFSFETWVQTSNLDTNGAFANFDSTPVSGFGLYTLRSDLSGSPCNGTVLECLAAGYVADSTHAFCIRSGVNIKTSGNVYTVVNHTAGSGNLSLYINNVLDSTVVPGNVLTSTGSICSTGGLDAADPATSTSTFKIGRSGDLGPAYWEAALDETIIRTVTLTGDQRTFDLLDQTTPSSIFSSTLIVGGVSQRRKGWIF
jgi:hypothetical protein